MLRADLKARDADFSRSDIMEKKKNSEKRNGNTERGVPAESSGKEGEVKHNPKSLKDGKYRSKTSDTKMINKKSEREVKPGY